MAEMKALIPVMTSNTEPSGIVEYSSVWTSSGNYKGYHAFDDNNSTYWAASSNSPNQWISYEFPERKRVTQIFIDAGNEGSSVDSYKLQYHNGSDWVDLFDYRTYGNGVSETYSFSNNVYAKKYRVIFGGSSTHNTRTIQLYGYDDIVKGLVPAMTSVNTPEGECILYATGGSPAGDAPFYRVFDGNPSTIGGWANNDVVGTGTKDAYIGYHFTKPVKCAYAEFRWGGENNSGYIFGVKLQGSNDGTSWVDLSEPVNIQKKTTPTVIESTKPDKYFTYLCIRYVSYSTPTNTGYPQAHEIQFYGTDDPPRIKSSGSTEAIRDWLNASLYNKEEIDDLFIQNNQAGLIPYDLMITGDQPEQMIKLVGQTSGKTYNICLAAILGDDMKETVLWENSGTTRPNTITLNDDWTKYKWLTFGTTVSINSNRYLETYIYPTSLIKKAIQNNSGSTIALCFNANSSDYLWYSLSNNTLTYMDAGGNNPIPTSILGYS